MPGFLHFSGVNVSFSGRRNLYFSSFHGHERGPKVEKITFVFRKIDMAQEICFLIWRCTYFSIGNEQFPMLFGQIIATSHDLTPKWWFSKGKRLSVGEERVVKYYNLARLLC